MASLSMVFDILARDNASPTFREVGREAERTGRKLDSFSERGTAAAATMRAAIGGPGGIALAATAAAGALSPMAGTLALLPGLLAAGGAAFAPLAVGLNGFGEALENIGDPEKFAEALERLSPAARATAEAMRDLGPGFGELRLDVQEALFTGLADSVQGLSAALPTLRSGMVPIAETFNGLARSLADALTESGNLRDLGTIFTNTNAALQPFGEAVGSLLQAFRDIAVVASQFLPGLAGGFADAAARFAEFIASARDSGALSTFIQTGLDAARDFATVVGAIIEGLTGAFGPFSLARDALGGLADNAGRLTQVVEAAVPLFLAYRAALFGSAVIAAIGAVATGVGAVVVVTAALVGGLIYAYRESEQFRDVVNGAFQRVQEIVQQFAAYFVDELLPIIVRVWGDLKAAFTGGETSTTGSLGKVQEVIRATVEFATTWFAAFSTLVTTVTGAIQTAWELFGDNILSYIETIFTSVGTVVSGLLGVLTGILNLFIGVFTGDWTRAWDGIKGIVSGAFTAIGGLFTAAFGTLAAAVSTFFTTIGALFTTAWGGLQTTTSTGVSAVVGFVAALPGRIGSALSTLASGLASIASGAWGSFRSAAATKVAELMTLVVGIPGRIKTGLGDLGGLLEGAGRAIVQGLIDGIRSLGSAAVQAARDVAAAVADAAKGVLGINSPSRVFMGIGANVSEGFAIGIQDSAGLAQRALTDLTTGSISSSSISGGDFTGGGLGDKLDRIEQTLARMPREYQLGQRQMVGA